MLKSMQHRIAISRRSTMPKTLLKSVMFGSLLVASSGSIAQGYYEFIPYYGNSPFLFCQFGVPTDCWYPINPATGTYGVSSWYCFNPVSAAQFARVCPHAFVGAQVTLPTMKQRDWVKDKV
jgi:hypothetical protein